jgi:hypothetical protein
MTSFFRIAAIAAVTAAAVQLTGCASIQMTAPQAALENTAKLRTANLAPAAVGSFTADAKAGSDNSMSIRGGNSVQAPGGSFAKHLGETLKAELQTAGLLDAASANVITGTLTSSVLNASIGTADGKLAARFVVTRAGAVKYDRELSVDSSWESSFIGAVAIPLAANNYEGLYRKLITKLLDDADFRKSLAK